MSDHAPDTKNTPTDIPQSDAVDPSRRKLTGAALGVSAVFTLASRPVLASVCQSPSGHQSGNVSQHGTSTTCSGKSPGYWKEHPESWPSPYVPGTCTNPDTSNNGQGYKNQVENWSGGTLFHPFFSGSQFMADLDRETATTNTSLSMMQVMIMSDGSNPWGLTDTGNLGSHIVAALLNAKAGLTDDVLDETAVIGMWTEWAANGYYEPTAGVKWYAADIVRYITSTFS